MIIEPPYISQPSRGMPSEYKRTDICPQLHHQFFVHHPLINSFIYSQQHSSQSPPPPPLPNTPQQPPSRCSSPPSSSPSPPSSVSPSPPRPSPPRAPTTPTTPASLLASRAALPPSARLPAAASAKCAQPNVGEANALFLPTCSTEYLGSSSNTTLLVYQQSHDGLSHHSNQLRSGKQVAI